MTCSVPKKEKTEYVQLLVLEYFRELEGPDVVITLGTSLGGKGLGHTMVKRKGYHRGIAAKLEAKGQGCRMKTLTPQAFTDSKLKFVGDVAALVEKDLV